MAKDVDKTLAHRESRYGDFADVARSSQRLQDVIRAGKNFDSLSYAQKEAVFMICNKISRMVNGDTEYTDNAHDMAGYSTLLLKEMEKWDSSK